MAMAKWNILDFIQYKRISRKAWNKSRKMGRRFITIFPIRKHVKKQLMNEGHLIYLTETKRLFRIYHIW